MSKLDLPIRRLISILFCLIFFFLIEIQIAASAPPPLDSDEPSTPAQTQSPPAPEQPPPPELSTFDENERLPDIEAQTFSIRVMRKSNSNRVYFLEDVQNHQPKVGRILLFKRGRDAIMAFRILKTYPQEKKVAAKRVKRYGKTRILEDGETYLAIEKISEVNLIPTSQDKDDLQELESHDSLNDPLHNKSSSRSKSKGRPKALAYDPDLDAPTTPHVDAKDKQEDEPDATSDDLDSDPLNSHLAVTVEQTELLDHNKHWLTAGFGFVRNYAPPATGGTYLFSAGNIRYGYTLGQLVFFDRPRLQDSIAVDAGFYMYKSINFAIRGDAYTLLSLVGNIRYNLMFSKSMGIFFYLGIISHRVMSTAQGQAVVSNLLGSTLPTGGGGILFEVGPNWYTRVDLGIESLTLNLMLRF